MPNKIYFMELSKSEEDYLKALFSLTIESQGTKAGNNQLAEHLGLSPASVNSMLKKLKSKELVIYEKYGKLADCASAYPETPPLGNFFVR